MFASIENAMKFKHLLTSIGSFAIFLIYLSLNGQMNAHNHPNGTMGDSLRYILNHCKTDKEKIGVLKKLVNFYWQQPEEIDYMKQIINIANQVDSINIVYEGLAGLCRYYYNVGNTDSMFYWKQQLDSLSFRRKESPEALFRAGMILCRKHLEDANYELAMNEALLLMNRAKQETHEYGLLTSNQNLGLIYQSVRRDSEAVVSFREGLKWEKWNISRPGLIMQYLADMLVSTLRLESFDESEELLEKYLSIYEQENKRYKDAGLVYPMQWHTWLIYSFYTELYTRKNQLDKAAISAKKATEYIASETDESMKSPYYHAMAMYYQQVGHVKQALQMIDKALNLNNDLVILKRKVDILRADGQTQKALTLYEDLLKKNSEVSNDAFDRQIKQLRILNDSNDMNKQANALQYQKEQLALRLQLIFISIVFSLILLGILYFLIRYYRRNCRLKNELICEKDSLLASEKLLQEAKEDAEDANSKKTAFIANISHEVRTPLNAIVGFSELLAEENINEDDKKEFALTISRNSEVLMTLVNDVLDLSRLESPSFHFTLKPCEIISCCREIIEDTKKRLKPEVCIVFNSPADSYELITDYGRTRQLLNKLLWNASKFTDKGVIILDMEIDEEEQVVRFIVTDTGCGIPIEKQELVFDRFEKLDDFIQGTGLGLPICRLIAKKLGGSLTIDPSYMKGTRFIFVHPIITIA